jgi:hypothetical protein
MISIHVHLSISPSHRQLLPLKSVFLHCLGLQERLRHDRQGDMHHKTLLVVIMMMREIMMRVIMVISLYSLRQVNSSRTSQ